MKTDFLKGLGLEQAAIDQIMAENGKDIKAEQDKVSGIREQLSTATDRLKAFDGVDVNDLKTQVSKLSGDLALKEKQYNEQITDMEFTRTLEGVMSGAKARNIKAAAALLDVPALKASKNQQKDIEAAIESLKKDNSYLFEVEAPFSGRTPGPAGEPPASKDTAKASDALRSVLRA